MDEKFVVVDRVIGGIQGEIIIGLLHAAGLRAEAFGQGGAREIGVGAVAEVDIVVPAEQEAEARILLEAYYAGELEGAEDSGKEDEEGDAED
jgi:hypothetical protein